MNTEATTESILKLSQSPGGVLSKSCSASALKTIKSANLQKLNSFIGVMRRF